jgi:hypothetical protein
VTDLGLGKLDKLDGGCELTIRLEMPASETGLPTGLLGEVTITSDDKRLTGRKIVVSEIGLIWR